MRADLVDSQRLIVGIDQDMVGENGCGHLAAWDEVRWLQRYDQVDRRDQIMVAVVGEAVGGRKGCGRLALIREGDTGYRMGLQL